MDASITAKDIPRRQPANAFCYTAYNPERFPVLTKSNKKFPTTIALTQSVNYFTVRSNHPTSRSEQNLYDRMIPRNTVFTKLAWLFHIIVNIPFSYGLLIRK